MVGILLEYKLMAPWFMPLRTFIQRNAIANVVTGAGRLVIAFMLAVVLCTAFGAVAQGHELTPTGTVEEVLQKGLRLAEASPSHLAVRGTGVGNSARCDWRGIARTTAAARGGDTVLVGSVCYRHTAFSLVS